MNRTRQIEPLARLYTATQARELDRITIEDHGIPGMELMERAGKAAFERAVERFPASRNWLVVCGAGNNAGDGYVIAGLAREKGIECSVSALKAPENLAGDAATAARRWLDAGGTTTRGVPNGIANYDLIVDALLGTGLDRAPRGEYAEMIKAVNGSQAPILAVDIPSGLDADTGTALGGVAIEADMTVTFIGRKRGLYTADGPDHAGIVRFESLDVPSEVYAGVDNAGLLIQENWIAEFLEPRRKNSHKGSYGWILGVGGDVGMSGALHLCGAAALRSGGGKVTLATHPAHASWLNLAAPELMVSPLASGGALEEWLAGPDVLVLGTGLGHSSWSEEILASALQFRGPRVIDADALNLLASRGVDEVTGKSGKDTIMTPHPAEASRLLGKKVAEIQQDRVTAAQELAALSGATVVLKGCGTVVAGPDGGYAICAMGNPGMASAGTGDVLAGVIGALLGQGMEPWEAATVGVAAHAAAGDRAASQCGERGLIASDIIESLPAVLNPGQQPHANS
jgi:hydroxyethylthiazole kinase-like uncharacterized protein yjeF